MFQYELYKNFEKYFQELAPDFRSFEIDSGFLGIRFETEEDATSFDAIIKRMASIKNDVFSKPKAKEDNAKQNEEKTKNYCEILKKNFSSEDSKYDENYAEDGTTILKHNNFKILV